MKIEIKLLGDIVTEAPRYATSGAAAVDLSAAITMPLKFAPMERALVSTGIALAIPEGYVGLVCPRSGLAMKHGITVLNAPGVIDPEYSGILGVVLVNLGSEIYAINPRDRIAQLMLCPVEKVEFEVVSELKDTVRGSGGFGSTGAE